MSDADGGRFTFHPTPLDGVLEVERHGIRDERGTFARLFCVTEFAPSGLFPTGPVQINMATTARRGTVRGMHAQERTVDGRGEAKLVTCIAGRVLDVALDLREESPTFGVFHAVELAAGGARSLLIPPGVAHGMQALEDATALLYLHSAAYDPAREMGVHPEDAAIGIPWPLPVIGLSDRDRGHPGIGGSAVS